MSLFEHRGSSFSCIIWCFSTYQIFPFIRYWFQMCQVYDSNSRREIRVGRLRFCCQCCYQGTFLRNLVFQELLLAFIIGWRSLLIPVCYLEPEKFWNNVAVLTALEKQQIEFCFILTCCQGAEIFETLTALNCHKVLSSFRTSSKLELLLRVSSLFLNWNPSQRKYLLCSFFAFLTVL